MGGVAKAVTGAVDSVVSTVGDAVEDVGDFVVDEVVKPVANAVEKTVQAAMDDPVNTAIRVGAFVVGGPAGLAIANGTIALAQGQSIGDAALIAGKTYAIGQAGAAAGQAAGAAATEAGYGTYAANTASGATAGATRSVLGGGDAQTGALMGALGGVNRSAAQDISDEQFANAMRDSANSQPDSYSPTEQDVLARDPSIKMDFPLTTPTDQSGPGYFDEETGKFIPSQYGQYSAPLDDTSGTNYSSMDGYTHDPSTNTWTSPDGTTTDLGDLSNSRQAMSGSDLLEAPEDNYKPGSYDPLLTRNQIAGGLNFATNAILNGSSGTAQNAPVQRGLQSISNGQQIGGSGELKQNWLGEREMLGDSTGDPYELMKLKQLYATLTPEMQQALATNNGQKAPTGSFMQPEQTLTMASGGSATPWDELVKSAYNSASTKTNQPVFMGGGQRRVAQVTPLTQLAQGIGVRKAEGGLSLAHGGLPKGHKPEFVTGHTGYYANGKGTGQSDDIPAVLQHGDFVVDADTVAALGDGSSKAGAQTLEQFRRHIPVRHKEGGHAIPAQIADGEYVLPAAFVTALGQGDNARGAKMLDAMRHQIREHKRSAPTSKIPPKAKNPLEYIKMGTKG